MKYATMCGLLLVVGGTGCAGIATNPDFGPYPAGSFGGLTAGIASFINIGPGGTQFTLVIFNTDDANPYDVTVTVDGGAPTTLTIAPCEVGATLVSCIANNVVVSVTGAGAGTVTLQPDPFDCQNVQLFIAAEGGNVTLSPNPPAQTNCTNFQLP